MPRVRRLRYGDYFRCGIPAWRRDRIELLTLVSMFALSFFKKIVNLLLTQVFNSIKNVPYGGRDMSDCMSFLL